MAEFLETETEIAKHQQSIFRNTTLSVQLTLDKKNEAKQNNDNSITSTTKLKLTKEPVKKM